MDRKKLVIIVLVIVAIVYLASLGTHFVPKERDNTSKDSYIADSKKSDKKGGFETTLNKLMSPFAPRLPVMQLLNANRGSCDSVLYQSQFRVIQLTENKKECTIVIARFKDDDFRKGKLTLVDSPGGRVKVRFTSNDPDLKGDEQDEPVLRDNEPVDVTVTSPGGTLVLHCESCSGNNSKPVRVKFE